MIGSINGFKVLLISALSSFFAISANAQFSAKKPDNSIISISTPDRIIIRATDKSIVDATSIVILRTVSDSVEYTQEDKKLMAQFEQIKKEAKDPTNLRNVSSSFNFKRSIELPDTLFIAASPDSMHKSHYCWLIKAKVGNFYQLEDNSVLKGYNYKYEVLAFDENGQLINKEVSVKARLRDNYVEKTTIESISISHQPGEQAVTLSWDLNYSPEYLGAVIYRSNTEEEFMQPLSGMLQQSHFTDNSVVLGQTYYYQIRVFSSPALISRSKPVKVYITP